MEPNIVERPSWLDAEFLEDVFRSREEYGSIIVVDSKVEVAVGKGENYTSTLYRVGVDFKRRNCDEDATERTSLIIKTLSCLEIMAKFLIESNVFGRETTMYQVTIPSMVRLLQERVRGRKVEQPAPFCYKTSKPHTLVLEDLHILGFKMADRRSRLDLVHCITALKGLARFHAMSVALHDKDPSTMDTYEESIYVEKNREMMNNFSASAFSALANVVEKWSGFEEYGEKFRGLIPIIWERQVEMVKPVEGSLSVLNHGDCWVNNMMFHYCTDTGEPDQVMFVDFQLSRYSSPALDLQYFIYTSPSEDVRSEYTEHLLEEYYQELCDTLNFLGCDQHQFTIEQLKKEFKEKSFFGLITACTVLTAVLAEPTETIDMANIKEDGSNIDLKAVEKPFTGNRYKEAFQKLIPHFVERGLI